MLQVDTSVLVSCIMLHKVMITVTHGQHPCTTRHNVPIFGDPVNSPSLWLIELPDLTLIRFFLVGPTEGKGLYQGFSTWCS
jgi:hypothetical protein